MGRETGRVGYSLWDEIAFEDRLTYLRRMKGRLIARRISRGSDLGTST